MSSITTWMRLEPHCRAADMSVGLQGRVYDPLWLLARQWQIGEFQGEDNGSPASARWQGEAVRLSRYHPAAPNGSGPIEGASFDSDTVPLETLVEREPARSTEGLGHLRSAADAGQHFLRMLGQQPISRSYRDLFVAAFPFTPLTEAERALLDEESLNFVDIVMPRLPDGRRLYAALSASLRPAPPARGALPRGLAIAAADTAEVQVAAEAWLLWYEMMFPAPLPSSPWSAERMEYGFSVAARMSGGEKVLTAGEYFDGHIDWHDFNLGVGASLGAAADPAGTGVTRTVIPAPVTYRGMPASRFWAFEDASVDFGAVDAGPEDLARMLLVEFAVSYGNDWFVIPVDLPAGSLCRTSSLVVTNTFGERFIIRSASESGPQFAAWRMFQISSVPGPGNPATVTEPDLFFLSPRLPSSLESRPIEEVLFLRDEMANMAWGVERVVESATERPLNRFEQPESPAPVIQASGVLHYRLATSTPDNWVPLLPVQTATGLRLRRGKVLKVDGIPRTVEARGRILNPDGVSATGLAIYEEEVPREGVRVTRGYQLARWHDGSTHLWIGRRKAIGRGEGSSGLRFDTLDPGT